MHQGAAPRAFGHAPDLQIAAVDFAAGSWARNRLSRIQWIAFTAAVAGGLAAFISVPEIAAAAAVGIAIVLNVGHWMLRNLAWFTGVVPSFPPAAIPREEGLPLYSIIVPMRDEPNMAISILRAISRLDYPKDRLDVIFALEHDDPATQKAIRRARPPAWCRVLVVPPSDAQTKPNACNYALRQARGDYVVVYDAEDRPEADQLREALATFRAHGERVACVQARLAPYNRDASFYTRMFAVDFCQWFDGMLGGLQRLGFPLPLGGTSNHFRVDVLRRAGAWDPFNVTEDADLGLRLWRLGFDTRMLESTTWEEAPIRFRTWFNQRTRWIRGYMQTFFVHARSPKNLGLPPLGPTGWFFLVLFVGASWIFALVNPLFWGMFGYSLVVGGGGLDWAFGPLVGSLASLSLVTGNFLGIFVAVAGPVRRRWRDLQFWALATPVYWVLVSIVAYWALFTFFWKPHRWEKTPHGLDPRIERL